MRKCMVAGVVSLMLVTACKSTADEVSSSSAAGTVGTPGGSGATGTSAPSGAASSDPRAPGVSADTIKVGVAFLDLSRLKDILKIDHGDYEAAYRALFDDVNARGGINGRMLEPVIVPVHPSGTAAADAACTKLTQDEQVFVAIGFFRDDNVLCYLDVNPTPVIGGTMTSERLSKAKVAWYTTEASEDAEADAIRALVAAGELGDKVAVVGMAADQQALDSTIEPVLAELGVTTVETALIDAPATDTAANYAAAEVIAQRFESAGAEQVLVLGTAAAVPFMQGILRTAYRPQLVFSNLNAISAFTSNDGNDFSILEGALAGAPYDLFDDFLTMGGATKECVDNQTAAGLVLKHEADVPEGEPTQAVSSLLACSQMALLEAILQKAGPDLDFGTFKAAGDSLGAIDLASYPDPMNYGAPPSADGDPKVYVYEWDTAAADFVLSES